MKLTSCITVLKRVFKQHHSLTDCFYGEPLSPEQKAVCYGVIRWQLQLDALLQTLLLEPLKEKNLPVKLYLYIGLFQIFHSNMPEYAVVKEVVNNIKQSKFRWAAGLSNKILRKAIDEKNTLLAKINRDTVARYAHPAWMIEKLDPSTLAANNQQAPMTLRVNLQQVPRSLYLKKLLDAGIDATALNSSKTAIQLKEAVNVQKLPGFDVGLCSVQDEAGQLIAEKLALKPNLRVLDACCAPGSKTCHILETEPKLAQLTALDIDAKRLKKVNDNLNRLKLNTDNIKLIAADATDIDSWWDGEPFDRILIDAPCSASGVIRRHPDIKHLRRESDITDLQQRQLHMLTVLSKLLAKNGILIYSTCSIFKEENGDVIQKFIEKSSFKLENELQLLPQENGHDGFYIATMLSSWLAGDRV